MGKAEPPPETDSGGGRLCSLMQFERGGRRAGCLAAQAPPKPRGFRGSAVMRLSAQLQRDAARHEACALADEYPVGGAYLQVAGHRHVHPLIGDGVEAKHARQV